MARSAPTSSKPESSKSRGSFFAGVGIAVASLAALVWFMQSEANDRELVRELRTLPGGDAWLTEWIAWVEAGGADESRTIWLASVDELVRTDPEVGDPELLAVKMVGATRIAGRVERRAAKLYVIARGYDFVGKGVDEPLSGHRWLVATFENEHGQPHCLQAAFPVPPTMAPAGAVVE